MGEEQGSEARGDGARPNEESIRELAERFDRTAAELRREHEARTRRAGAFAEVAALTGGAAGAHDFEGLMSAITEVAIRHIADLAAVLLLDEADGSLRVAQVSHRDATAQLLLRSALRDLRFDKGPSAIGDAIDGGVPVLDVQGPLHPTLPELLRDFNERFPVGHRHLFPMESPHGPVGVLVLTRDLGADPFGPDDSDLAMVLATRAALAVRTAQLESARRLAEAAIERRLAQQAAVAQLGTRALSGEPLADVAARCCELVEATLGGAICGVWVDDGHPDGLRPLALSERVAPLVAGRRLAPGPEIQQILDLDGSVFVPDLATEDRFAPSPLMVAAGVASLVATTIEARGGATGLLSAASEVPSDFTIEDLTFLEAMANVVASAMAAQSALDDLRHHALHDPLTGLPNRALVLDRLEVALDQALRRDGRVAVLACDLDRFKIVNDGLGHAAGDEVLRVVAERLRLEVRPGDTVGRFGGDEFIVVCPDVTDADAVVAIAERLGRALRRPMRVLGKDLVVTPSIGIAFGAGAGPDAASRVLRDADAAMYRAKARGRARHELFDEAMRSRASVRLRMEADLRQALARDELVLHYQPVLDLRTEAVVGVEALVRWQHPTRGLLGPAEFLPVAVESGLMPDVGDWVLTTAATQAAAWDRADPGRRWWVAVNLAPRQLLDPQLCHRVDQAVSGAGVDAGLLRVEITEEALIDDAVHAAALLRSLRDRGLGISVDDFGTGYSSLAYLKRLPVDSLKLDRGFVAGLGAEASPVDGEPEHGDDEVIAAAVIAMAQALELRVVAEGVETAAQLEVLRSMGCDQAQGHLFAHPLPADDLERWFAAR